MRVHFSYISLESGAPYGYHVYVKNSTHIVNDFIFYYISVWSDWVEGNTLQVQLLSDSDSDTGSGFQVDLLEVDLGSNNIAFRVLDLSGSVLPLADITLSGDFFNFRKISDSKGWANFTTIPNDTYLVTTRWQGNVVNQTTITFSANVIITIYCRVYSIGFANSFRDFSGNPLYANPSNFKLTTPNGTITYPLPVTLSNGTALSYRLQNGTIRWHSIIWQDTEVLPVASSDFYAEDGDPEINCKVYSLKIDPIFKDNVGSTLNFQPSSWVVNFPNRTLRTLNASVTYSQIQGGDYSISSITWQGIEVVPTILPKMLLANNTLWTPSINCQLPTKTNLSVSSPTIDFGTKVNIYGDLTCNNVGLSEASIQLSYMTTGENSWSNVMLVKTEFDGVYSGEWVPSAIGSYIMKATWIGNSTYPGSSATVNIAVVSPSIRTQLWIIIGLCGIIAGALIVFLVKKRYRRYFR
jgi:hypothetical protein